MCSKTWTFTLNNYDEKDEQLFKDLEKNYLVYGREVGESGTPHLQGFIIFKRSYRLTQLKKISPKCHWEKALAKDAGNYCMKDKDYYVEDNRRKTSHAYKEVMEMAKKRKFREIMDEHPALYMRYRNTIRRIEDDYSEGTRSPPVVFWLYGGTGTGKTRFATELNSNSTWMSSDNLKWFDGYNGQECAVIDDFRAASCSYNFLLRLLDRYPLRVQTKGGFTWWTPKYIVITTYGPPSTIYRRLDEADHLNQLHRRITYLLSTDTIGWDVCLRLQYGLTIHRHPAAH
jgi:hypothetical protein